MVRSRSGRRLGLRRGQFSIHPSPAATGIQSLYKTQEPQQGAQEDVEVDHAARSAPMRNGQTDLIHQISAGGKRQRRKDVVVLPDTRW